MIQTLDLRGTRPTRAELGTLIPRARVDVAVALEAAQTLIHEVRERGSEALRDQAERFDRVRPGQLRVTPEEIARAIDGLDPVVRAAIEESIERVRVASAAQVPAPAVTELGPDARVEQRWQPVRRAGCYVPGGKAVYPSSVIMNVVPAQVAGVGSVVLASPPQAEFGGSVHPTILAAAGLLGVDEIFAMGGAGAIGALAYGVPDAGLEAVDIVTGPGNVYVAAAKRLVRGVVGIDAEAGPTEILVIADANADPVLVAADLLSQAEHDELAAAILVTDAPEFAVRVVTALEGQLAATAHRVRAQSALDAPQSAIVLVDDLAAAAEFSNLYGPEHLEIQTERPDEVLALISDAGAIFLGAYSPVSLGDYLAGSNHVLPTGGQARFSSGLGASAFLRPQQIVRYGREGLAGVVDRLAAFSEAEELPAHGAAAQIRFR